MKLTRTGRKVKNKNRSAPNVCAGYKAFSEPLGCVLDMGELGTVYGQMLGFGTLDDEEVVVLRLRNTGELVVVPTLSVHETVTTKYARKVLR